MLGREGLEILFGDRLRFTILDDLTPVDPDGACANLFDEVKLMADQDNDLRIVAAPPHRSSHSSAQKTRSER